MTRQKQEQIVKITFTLYDLIILDFIFCRLKIKHQGRNFLTPLKKFRAQNLCLNFRIMFLARKENLFPKHEFHWKMIWTGMFSGLWIVYALPVKHSLLMRHHWPHLVQRNWVFVTNSSFLIPIYLQPNVIDLRYHSSMPSSLAPDPIWVQWCVCCLFWINRNSMAVTSIFLSIIQSELWIL